MDHSKKRKVFFTLIFLSIVMLGVTVYLIMGNQGVEVDSFAAKNCTTKTLKCSCGITVSARECGTNRVGNCLELKSDSELKQGEAQSKQRECNAYSEGSDNQRFCMREFNNLEGYAKELEEDYENCLDREQAEKENIDIKLDQKLVETCYNSCTAKTDEDKNLLEKFMDSGNTLE